jgi:hypothetical protein
MQSQKRASQLKECIKEWMHSLRNSKPWNGRGLIVHYSMLFTGMPQKNKGLYGIIALDGLVDR